MWFGWVAQGWNVNELNIGKRVFEGAAMVVVFSGVRVLAWFVLCGVCGLVRSAGSLWGLVVLEGRAWYVMRMGMFGALLGFEATSLLAVLLLVGWGGWVLGVSVFVLCLLHGVLVAGLLAGWGCCVGVRGCCLGTV